jgi:hypothetical protein
MSAASQDFTIFPGLIPEIRLKIWRCALPAERVVEIQYDRHTDEFRQSKPGPVTNLLAVCKEAHDEVLKTYTGHFNVDHPIYLDTSMDTVQLTFNALLAWAITIPDAASIKRLELTGRDLPTAHNELVFNRLGRFANLEQLTIVYPRSPFPLLFRDVDLDIETEWRLERKASFMWQEIVVPVRAHFRRAGREVLVGMTGITEGGERRTKF